MTDEAASQRWTGGCQCGLVRYALATKPRRASICHCRMCQKAGGAPFMAFASVASDDFAPTRGKVSTFRSSAIAERGFCEKCGTPLTYRLLDSASVSVTIGSLDRPGEVAPSLQWGVESKLPWFASLASLPERTAQSFLDASNIVDVGVRQHPDRDT